MLTSMDAWWYEKQPWQRSKLTKHFYNNGQRISDHEKVFEKSADHTREISEATEKNILKVITKIEYPNTTPKTY